MMLKLKTPAADVKFAAGRPDARYWLERIGRGLRPDEAPALRAWLRSRSHRRAIIAMACSWHNPDVLPVLSAVIPIKSERIRRSRQSLLMRAGAVAAGLGILITAAVGIESTFDAAHVTQYLKRLDRMAAPPAADSNCRPGVVAHGEAPQCVRDER